MIRFVLANALAALSLFTLALYTSPALKAAEPPEEARLLAVSFHSANCPACQVLEPRINTVIPEYRGAGVKFVRFDFTFKEPEALEALAREKGLDDIFNDYRGATGFMLLVERGTGDILSTITVRDTVDDIRSAMDGALGETGLIRMAEL